MRQCVDIEFTADDTKVPELNESNCFNSTDIRVETINIVPATPAGGGGPPTTTRGDLFGQTSPPPAATGTAVKRGVSRFSAFASFLFML